MHWFDLGAGEGVLELDDPLLELQLRIWDGEAWWLWLSESGTVLVVVEAGEGWVRRNLRDPKPENISIPSLLVVH